MRREVRVVPKPAIGVFSKRPRRPDKQKNRGDPQASHKAVPAANRPIPAVKKRVEHRQQQGKNQTGNIPRSFQAVEKPGPSEGHQEDAQNSKQEQINTAVSQGLFPPFSRRTPENSAERNLGFGEKETRQNFPRADEQTLGGITDPMPPEIP